MICQAISSELTFNCQSHQRPTEILSLTPNSSANTLTPVFRMPLPDSPRSCKPDWTGKIMTLDEQLKRLEEDVRRLKIEFDVFFNGGAKRPPYETKSRVESTIKRL